MEYPCAIIYNVMSRGDRWEDIFHDDVDRQDFLKAFLGLVNRAASGLHHFVSSPRKMLATCFASSALS